MEFELKQCRLLKILYVDNQNKYPIYKRKIHFESQSDKFDLNLFQEILFDKSTNKIEIRMQRKIVVSYKQPKLPFYSGKSHREYISCSNATPIAAILIKCDLRMTLTKLYSTLNNLEKKLRLLACLLHSKRRLRITVLKFTTLVSIVSLKTYCFCWK